MRFLIAFLSVFVLAAALFVVAPAHHHAGNRPFTSDHACLVKDCSVAEAQGSH